MELRIPCNESEGRPQCPSEFAYSDTSDIIHRCRWTAEHPGMCTRGNIEWYRVDKNIIERVARIKARWDEEQLLEAEKSEERKRTQP